MDVKEQENRSETNPGADEAFDYDAVIIGGGPAGLTAAIYLGRARYRVLLLEKEQFGGQIKNIEWVENYPGYAEGVSGPELASAMVNQALKYGARLEMGEVTAVESYSSCRSVICADGTSYTTAVVIVAGGARPRKLGVPGEDAFLRKGVIHCALCDGGQFADRIVAVCGGGDAGLTEALYLTNLASRVILFEAEQALSASAVLQERARANEKLEIRCGEKVCKVLGDERMNALEVADATGDMTIANVDGLLVHVGIEPNSDYLDDLLTLDESGRIVVNERLETEAPCIMAAGDIRRHSPGQIASAVGDGAIAAITAQRVLQMLKRDA